MTTPKIEAAVSEAISDAVKSEAELVTAISETASLRVEAAESMAAEVIASAETTALGVKLAALEERVNTWPSNALSASHLQEALKPLMDEVQELKNMMAELLDLTTEWAEETETTEPSSTPAISPAATAENSPLPDAKSEKPAPASNPRKSRLI